VNSACLAQGSASMWAARDATRALDMRSLSNIVIPIGRPVSSLKDSSQLTRSVFVNAV